jgi:hypothetical protein
MRRKNLSSEAVNVERTQGPQLSGSNLQRAGDHNQRVTLHAIRADALRTSQGRLSSVVVRPVSACRRRAAMPRYFIFLSSLPCLSALT